MLFSLALLVPAFAQQVQTDFDHHGRGVVWHLASCARGHNHAWRSGVS